jgi:radical SAM peptide maturase (CXXX-repeat target family)/CXXX repeat peptide maturase
MSEVIMGSLYEPWGQWEDGMAKAITFCVTDDCNLACKYCYMTGKNKKNRMSFEVAKKAVDYILSNREEFSEVGVVWDFIGGEPFLEIDLIDRISDYIKRQMYILDHPWFERYRFNFSTNGLLYDTPKVQNYIKKNYGHVSIGISVDGNKLKHDMQRVYPDGSGSYDEVVKNIPLWQKQFPGHMTKATFSHGDLPYLKDSIINLWNLGLKVVPANVVFEDVWHEGDDIIFENQLKELADYILENKLWDEYSVRFFAPSTGFPMEKEALIRNFCGTGNMLAIDYKGDLFPCVRFCDISLNNRKGYCIGNIYEGIDADKLRPFMALSAIAQSSEECLNCEVASGCIWCSGCNYDMAETDTIYQRATYICKMHKANVRAVDYLWKKYSEVTGEPSSHKANESEESYYLQFLMSDDVTPHCLYRNWNNTKNVMSEGTFKKGLEFALKNKFKPVLIGENPYPSRFNQEEFINIIGSNSSNIPDNTIIVYDNDCSNVLSQSDNCILLVNKNNISNISNMVTELFTSSNRVNLILEDIGKWSRDEINRYKTELGKLAEFLINALKDKKTFKLNVLTDRLEIESMCNCDSGNSTYTLAPNGKIYICPAFYFDNPENYIGTLESGIEIKNKHLLELGKAPICLECDAYHCKRCKFLNRKMTTEYNTPPKNQCMISHIERNKTREMQLKLRNEGLEEFIEIIKEINYLDPLEKIMGEKYVGVKRSGECV